MSKDWCKHHSRNNNVAQSKVLLTCHVRLSMSEKRNRTNRTKMNSNATHVKRKQSALVGSKMTKHEVLSIIILFR